MTHLAVLLVKCLALLCPLLGYLCGDWGEMLVLCKLCSNGEKS